MHNCPLQPAISISRQMTMTSGKLIIHITLVWQTKIANSCRLHIWRCSYTMGQADTSSVKGHTFSRGTMWLCQPMTPSEKITSAWMPKRILCHFCSGRQSTPLPGHLHSKWLIVYLDSLCFWLSRLESDQKFHCPIEKGRLATRSLMLIRLLSLTRRLSLKPSVSSQSICLSKHSMQWLMVLTATSKYEVAAVKLLPDWWTQERILLIFKPQLCVGTTLSWGGSFWTKLMSCGIWMLHPRLLRTWPLR